jgi:hypothetical protein
MNARIALPLETAHQQQLLSLYQRMQAGTPTPLAEEAGQLVAALSCQLIDQIFGNLMRELVSHDPKVRLDDSLKAIDEVKSVLRKYLPWASSFFGNDRLMPVVAHYVGMIQPRHEGDVEVGYDLSFVLPSALAAQVIPNLEQLRTGQTNDLKSALELLIQVIDHSLDPMLHQPKALLKFNFIADKTLNGVVSVTSALSYRNIRKLGQHLPAHLHAPLATHLQKFVRQAL